MGISRGNHAHGLRTKCREEPAMHMDSLDRPIYRPHIILTGPENCLDNEMHRVRECPTFTSPPTDGTVTSLTSLLAVCQNGTYRGLFGCRLPRDASFSRPGIPRLRQWTPQVKFGVHQLSTSRCQGYRPRGCDEQWRQASKSGQVSPRSVI